VAIEEETWYYSDVGTPQSNAGATVKRSRKDYTRNIKTQRMN